MDDGQIVDLFLARDESAIHSTSEKYGSKLRHLANNICGDLTVAEECENDTYMNAWNSIPPHEPRNYLFSFLAKITRCVAIDRCKNKSRQKRSSVFIEFSKEIENCIPAPDDTASTIEGAELSRIVSEFLLTLPDEKRNIFLRRYWFMDSITAISERYSISEGKVKTVLFRVRNELRSYLAKEEYAL